MRAISEREHHIIVSALRVAAAQYGRDQDSMMRDGQLRLAKQFQAQAEEARQLAEKLENTST